MSHPLRVRGLKPRNRGKNEPLTLSHPLRVRGLKLDILQHHYCISRVAPPTGAWIETRSTPPRLIPNEVAPPTGAWIETYPADE